MPSDRGRGRLPTLPIQERLGLNRGDGRQGPVIVVQVGEQFVEAGPHVVRDLMFLVALGVSDVMVGVGLNAGGPGSLGLLFTLDEFVAEGLGFGLASALLLVWQEIFCRLPASSMYQR